MVEIIKVYILLRCVSSTDNNSRKKKYCSSKGYNYLANWGCSTSMYMNIKHTVYKIPSCSPSDIFSTMPTVGVAVANVGVMISDEYVTTI